MPKFEVVTNSVTECIYLLEAESFAEATMIALNDAPNDFVQKHLGEKVMYQARVDDDLEYMEWQKQKQHEGYF